MTDGFMRYKRSEYAELRPYRDGDDMTGVSVSAADRKAGSPRKGDMVARNPDDHDDQWLVARKFFKKNYVFEAGGSGYSAAFTHPDLLDPNDRVRQKTQARDVGFPYDSPTLYGGPIGTDLGGAAYQRVPDRTPPRPRNKRPSDVMPYGEYGVAWEQLESLLDPYSPGEQADDALAMGYGSHGRIGEDDREAIDLQGMFDPTATAVDDTVPGLLALLSMDSDGGCPGDDSYEGDRGEHVYVPGTEDDLT